MASKKASQSQAGRAKEVEEDAGLGDLEAHISQRINQLQTDDGTGKDPLAFPDIDGPELIAPVEPFGAFEFGLPEHSFPSGYDHQFYQESSEVLKTLHSLSDLMTDSLLNLNVRLNELESRIKELGEAQSSELTRLNGQVRELRKAMPADAQAIQPAISSKEATHSIADFMNELQKQVSFLKERMDRNVTDLGSKVEERQVAFLNMLDTRVKVIERVSVGYKDSLNRNFFNLAVLLIIIVVIGGTLISNSVDRMGAYVSQGLDTLRTAVHEAVDATRGSGEAR